MRSASPLIAFAMLFSIFDTHHAYGQILFVDADATGLNDGSNWENAFVDLQDALNAHDIEVWVADGVYRPSDTGDRLTTFWLKTGVELYGGFQGGEIYREQRDPSLHPTLLSGDLEGDDPESSRCCYPSVPGCDDSTCESSVCALYPDCCEVDWSSACAILASYMCDACVPERREDNSLHIVTVAYATEVILDGFVISGGNANIFPDYIHGGAVNIQVDTGDVLISNCMFISNSASWLGGAIFSQTDSLVVRNSIFNSNWSLLGGAIFFRYGSANIANCSLSGNSGVETANPSYGGAICFESGYLFLNNSELSGNRATYGGGVYDLGGGMEIANSTFAGNRAGISVGGLASTYFSNQPRNCIFWGNSDPSGTGLEAQIGAPLFPGFGKADYCCIQGLDPSIGVGNIASDPHFIDLDGPDDSVGTLDDDLRLIEVSPCIDAGSTDRVLADFADLDGDGNLEELTPIDRAGGIRLLDHPDVPDTGQTSGAVPVVDMGAYEFAHYCLGDTNYDHQIDPMDAGYVMARLDCEIDDGDPECLVADINTDGVVDPLDEGFVLSRLGSCP